MSPLLRIEFVSASAFPFGPPLRRDRGGRWLHATTEPIDVVLHLWDGRALRLTTIEVGFETDAISRPWWSRWLFKPWGPGWRGAVLHDWFLELMRWGRVGRPKMLVDLVMLIAVVAEGVGFVRALVMFFAVRTRKRRSPGV